MGMALWQEQQLETGTVVQVTHVQTRLTFCALLERKNESGSATAAAVLSFCSLERPYEKLRVALNGQVTWGLAATKYTSFLLEEATTSQDSELIAANDTIVRTGNRSSGFYARFRSLANQKKQNRDGEIGWYLGAEVRPIGDITSSETPTPVLVGDAASGESSLFYIVVVSTRAAFALDTSRMVLLDKQAAASSMLTDSQRQSFIQNGYLQIRNVVPMQLVNAALRRINHDLGIPGRMIDGGVEGSAKLAGNVSNSEEILNLYFLSDACRYAEALIGVGKAKSPKGAQIALRFPELGEPREPCGTEWHTDGMRQGKLHPFTLLVGIALSDVREPLAGNFTVFPGSHQTLQKLLLDGGRLEGCEDECYKADSVWGDGTLPDLGTPVQLLASRGDLVLAHPNLAHRGGLNFSPDIRYQIYFRLKHVDHAILQSQANENLWADLEGLQHFL